MAQQKQEDSTIDQIVQLVYPLSAEEHDSVVDKIRLHWHLPDEPREPWAQQNELSEDRRKIVFETERKVLKLVDRLAAGDQEKLLDELKLVWLRRAVDEGEESLRIDGGIPADEVFAELKKRAEARIRKSQQ